MCIDELCSCVKRDGKVISECAHCQRERAASGSGTPAAPSTLETRTQAQTVMDAITADMMADRLEELKKRLKGSRDAHDAEGLAWSNALPALIAEAVEREREECAKLAEQSLDSAFCKGSFYGQQVAKRIRGRASEPVPVSLSEAVWRTGGGSGQFRHQLGVKLAHTKDEPYAALTQNPYDEEPNPVKPAEGPAAEEGK